MRVTKHLTIVLFILSFSRASFSQNKNDCETLNFILKSEAARKIFFLDKNTEKPLMLIDTAHYFINCKSMPSVYGRSVTVTDDTALLKKASTSVIAIFGFIKRKNRYRVKFFYKQTGAVGFIEVQKNKLQYKILKSEFGYY